MCVRTQTCVSAATRPTLLAWCVQTAEHLKSSGWLPALMGLTSMTTGGLLSVNQRWGGERNVQAIRGKHRKKESAGGGRRSGVMSKEGRDKGRVKGAMKETPVMSCLVKNKRAIQSFNSGHSRWNFSLCSEHTVSLFLYNLFSSQTLHPNIPSKVYIISIKPLHLLLFFHWC